MNAKEKYELWSALVPKGTPVYNELVEIAENEAEIQARFGSELSFGTAGLRGIMGAGTDRMNIYTVRRAAVAYGQYIKAAPLPDTCAIAYDTRNNSRLFSETCAVALAEQGIHVYLFPEPMPTPALSFAVRHLGTGGGVVMTASHNPAAYNGMKCYGSDGCQQTDEPAAEVFARMQEVPMVSEPAADFDVYVADGSIELLNEEFYEAYYAAVMNESLCADQIKTSGLKLLYTPLHGTGLKPVTAIYDRMGVDYGLVTAQVEPDGDFPTCPYPNPETAPAFYEAEKVISEGKVKYDLVVATDPDADRVAVAVPMADGSLKRLSGNELGCLLLEYILDSRTRKGTLPSNSKCIKSIVTTPMVKAVAAAYGCENIDVLTGFKYIGSTILDLEQKGRENEVVFAFEESCGFLKGTYARDKDAQVACMLVAEFAAACKLEGLSVADKLEQLYRTYGFYKTRVASVELDGEAGKKLCSDFINSLRENAPAAIGSLPVKIVSDYQRSVETDAVSGDTKVLDFPKSNVLSYMVGDGCQVILRPSGTEPKLKVYYFACAPTEQAAEELLAALVADVAGRMSAYGI